jgi:signal peptidase I
MSESVERGKPKIGVHRVMTGSPKPWAAWILSFLVPGLGHQYAGFCSRAAKLLLLFPAAQAVVLVLIVLLPVRPANVIFPAGFILVLRAAVGAWAARDARSGSSGRVRARLSRWYGLVATVVLIGLVVNPLWAHAYRTTLVQAYKFPAGSMESTILSGDHVLVEKWTYGWRLPLLRSVLLSKRLAKRGDLAVFPFPEDPTRPFLKRVIGLPGETVEIRAKRVFINGQSLDEPYARFIEPPEGGEDAAGLGDNWGPQAVPVNAYFVLGDNRDNSRDSRFWGFVPQADLLGCARVVYWSQDPNTGRVRWNRIGLLLQ